GNLASTAGGAISDAGAVTIGGTTTLTAGGNNITLSQADDFVGPVSIVSGNNVSLNDVNTLTVGGAVAGKLTTTSGGALTFNTLNVGGDLASTAAGTISDAGAVNIGGATTLTAGGNDITPSQADDFVGPVNIASGNNVTLNDDNALTVGGTVAGKLTTTSGGALTLNTLTVGGDLASTAAGAIGDSGAVKIGGTTTLTAGGNDITLSQADDFVGPVSIVSGNNVVLNDVNALTLGASTVSGNLTVTAKGQVSDSGNVTVAGATSLTAGTGNNISLTHADDFVGPVSIVSGNNVTLNDINALTLGASTVSGNLTVTANGLLKDSGNVTIAGTTSLSAGAGNNIALTQADDFGGTVSILSGRDVTLNDINALTLGPSTVSRNLTLTANGLLSDAGNVSVAGATTVTVGSHDVLFTHADDFVGPVSIVSANNVTLNDVNALTLGASSIFGNLIVTANGVISDSGDFTVAGTTSLAAGGGNNILLNHQDDFAGPVSIVSGNDVTLNDVSALSLGASTVSGNLTVTAGGAINQVGPITANGAGKVASFSAPGNSITLLDPNNDFATASFIGGDVSVNDVNRLDLGASTITGNFTVTAGGP